MAAAQRPNPKRKGWFIIPGVQPLGDRTIEQQIRGLEPALAECRGKTVIDLGCAEGIVALAFAKAGATSVLGVERNLASLFVARWMSQGVQNVRFEQADLNVWAAPGRFDIVLALRVIHKFREPAIGAHLAASLSRDLICFSAASATWDGTVKSKHTQMTCNWFAIMKEHGFKEEKQVPYFRDDTVAYWRRA